HTRSKRDWSSDVCSSDLPERGCPTARAGTWWRAYEGGEPPDGQPPSAQATCPAVRPITQSHRAQAIKSFRLFHFGRKYVGGARKPHLLCRHLTTQVPSLFMSSSARSGTPGAARAAAACAYTSASNEGAGLQ